MAQLILPDLYPKQREFCEAEGSLIGFGGARGGGKSHVARIKMILLAYEYAGIQILLIRRTLAELRNNHVIPLIQILNCKAPNKNDRFAEYKDSKKEFVFPNGSRIVLGYCEHEQDVFQFQGQAYEAIFMEEATLFEEGIYTFLSSSNRLSGMVKKPIKPRMYFTMNPGGVGHQWVKKLFIDNPLCNDGVSGIIFIQSKVYDNEFLMKNDPEYVHKLEKLPDKLRMAFLDGDWDVFDGQFFEEFNRDKHVIEPFPIPDNWRKYRARDYGFDMLATIWIAIDTYGCAYVYKICGQPNLTISKAGQLINEVNGNDEIWLDIAPPDLFARNRVDYRSTVDIFQEECGQYLVKASNDRESGWLSVREWLQDVTYTDNEGIERTHPKLRIFRNCSELIRCIPLLVFDEKNPNDCSKQPHDITHFPDALRYFCSSWSFPPIERKETQALSWIEKSIKEGLERLNGESEEKGVYDLWD